MEDPNVDWKNLSLKSKFMMSYIRELGEKLDRVGKGLDSIQKDTQIVNANVEALSREKKEKPKVASLHDSEGSFGDNLSEHGRVERNRKEERRDRHGRIGEEPREEELDMFKSRIPHSLGNYKLGAYGQRVVRLVTLEFGKFVPPSYARDLHNKLRRLYKGSKSVEEYHKEIEMDLMRAQIRESEKATLAWFLHGLNREIQDVVELQHFGALRELVHQAIKVEMKIKRKMVGRGRIRRKRGPEERKTLRRGVTSYMAEAKTSSIKCFKCLGKGHIASQCPNRRVMIVKKDGEVESKDSLGEATTSGEAETLSDDSHHEGDFLVVRQLMNNNIREEAKT
ncbi:hypothetical protein CR513_17177, partial [Mucuna pruriens]